MWGTLRDTTACCIGDAPHPVARAAQGDGKSLGGKLIVLSSGPRKSAPAPAGAAPAVDSVESSDVCTGRRHPIRLCPRRTGGR